MHNFKDTNTRARQMWEVISQNVDFRKKYVIDLGCGHGEMLWRCVLAGAEYVVGCDKEQKPNARELAMIYPEIKLIETDLNVAVNHGTPYWLRERAWDIALCFSVLPYLDDPHRALKWMAKNFPEVLLEIQYEPEPYNICTRNDEQTFSVLRRAGFEVVYQIGQSYVESRDVYRTIWKCQKVER